MIERETTDQSQDWNAEGVVDDQKHHFESGRSSLFFDRGREYYKKKILRNSEKDSKDKGKKMR